MESLVIKFGSMGLTAGLALLFTALITRSMREGAKVLRLRRNKKVALRYREPDSRLIPLEFFPNGRPVTVRGEGGELGPEFWGMFIDKWRKQKRAGDRLVLLFGRTLTCKEQLYDRFVRRRADYSEEFAFAYCHPVLRHVLLHRDKDVDLYWKHDPNDQETHYLLVDDDGRTTLIEDSHGADRPGGGMLYRYHPEEYDKWLRQFEEKIGNREFCTPFNRSTAAALMCKVPVESADTNEMLGTLAGTLEHA